MKITTKIIRAAAMLMLAGALVVPGFTKDDPPAPATELMLKAKEKAAREHKSIFVMFDASW